MAHSTACAQRGVAVDDGRRQRLLGEHVVEDHEGVGSVRVVGSGGGQLAAVARPAVALSGDERLLHQVDVLERLHVDGEPAGGELRRHVALRRGAGDDADDGAVHVVDAREAAVGGDHHLLAVVERRVQERDAVVAVAARRPRRVAHEDVDLAGLQGREPGVCGQRDELDLRRVTEHGGRDDAAEVGVEADVLAGLVDDGEAGEVVAARRTAATSLACTVSSSESPGLHLLAAVGGRRAGGRAARRRVGSRVAGGDAVAAGRVGRHAGGRRVGAAAVVVVGAARGDQGDRRHRYQGADERTSHEVSPRRAVARCGDLSRGTRSARVTRGPCRSGRAARRP